MVQKLQERQNTVFRQTLTASYENIDQACDRVMAYYHGRMTKKDRFIVRLLLCEALTNAVRHGCAGNGALSITCETWLDREFLCVRVTDPGPGFDWQATMRRRVQPLQCSGHGLQIIRQYAAGYAYNTSGNQLTLTYPLSGGCHDNV